MGMLSPNPCKLLKKVDQNFCSNRTTVRFYEGAKGEISCGVWGGAPWFLWDKGYKVRI